MNAARELDEPVVVEPAAPARARELVEVNPRIPLVSAPFEILRALRSHRHLAWDFIARDIRLKYRDSALGYVWSLLEPLMLAGVYYVLYVVLAGKPDPTIVLWIILGVITYQYFTSSLQGVLGCLTKNEALIKQVYFPRELFALCSVGSEGVFATMNLVVAIPMMIIFGIPPSLYLLMIPLGMLLAGVLALGLGLTLACLNVVNRDIEHLVKFLCRVGLYISPVLYTIDNATGGRQKILHFVLYNPLTVPITMVRNGVAGHSVGTGLLPVVTSLTATVLAYCAGSMIFKRYEAEVVKKL